MRKANAIAIAGGAIAVSMIDKLVSKGILTNSDARDVLMGANAMLDPFVTYVPDASQGCQIIGEMLKARAKDRK